MKTDLVLGGQGIYVTLQSSNVSYDANTFQATVTVQNLTTLPIGTPDSTSVTGIKVFFASGPTVTSGTGAVTLENADSMGTFTATDQPFFFYDQILQPLQVSAPRTWLWNVPTTVNAFTFEVLADAAAPEATLLSTPIMVQHVSTPNTRGQGSGPGVPGLYVRLPNPTLSNNCILVVVQWQVTAGVTVSVSDDQSNKYTTGPAMAGSTGLQSLASFYALGATAGTRVLTITFSGGTPQNVSAVASEWYNVATASAGDGSATTESTTGTSSWAAGTFTPTTSGDLIYQVAANNTEIPTMAYPTFTPRTGFALASADVSDGMVSQYGIQAAAGPINPTITRTGGNPDGYVSLALALKAAAAGTAPSAGIRVVRIQHNNFYGAVTIPVEFPCSGNLIIGPYDTGNDDGSGLMTRLSDGLNTYAQITGSPSMNEPGAQQLWYAGNATSGLLTLTATLNEVATRPGGDLILYDVTGAAISPLDTQATATGIQIGNGPLTTVAITPASPGELIVAWGDEYWGTGNGTVTDPNGHTPLFENPTWPGQDCGIGNSCNSGAYVAFALDAMSAMYYTTDATTVTFIFALTNAGQNGVGAWLALSAAFKGR